MKYAVVFTWLAFALAWLASSSAEAGEWWVSLVEAYLAIGLLALAIAYGLKQAGMAVEEVARHPRWTASLHLLLAPYRGLAWLSLAVTRPIDRGAGMSRVGPGLFVGRLPSRAERGRLSEGGIDAV